MFPILTEEGTGVERLRRALEALCDLVDRHLHLMLANDEAFHQPPHQGRRPDYLSPFIAFLRQGAADGTLAPGDDVVEAADAVFNATAWPYVHFRGRHGWAAARARRVVVELVLNGVTQRRKRRDHERSLRRAARSAQAGRAPDPRAAAPGRARRASVRDLQRRDDERALVGRELDAARAGRRQPARRGLDREPRALRLVRRHAGAPRRVVRLGRGARASGPSSRSATSAACTSTAGATAARTSTSGSSRDRSGCSRRRACTCRSGRTRCRTSPTRSSRPPRRACRGDAMWT